MLGRYGALRTVFHASGADLFKEVIPAGEFGIEVEPLELSGEGLEQDLTAFVDRPFHPDGRLLVRMATAEHPDGDVLCVTVHHLVFDMVSMALFIEAFISVYEAVAAGRPVPAPPAAAGGAEPERTWPTGARSSAASRRAGATCGAGRRAAVGPP